MVLDYRKLRPVIDVISEECGCEPIRTRPGTLDSEALYSRLVGEGEHFAEGELDALLNHLRERGLISVVPARDDGGEAVAKHGALTITGTAPGLC